MTKVLNGSIIAQDQELRHLSALLVKEGYKVVRQGLKLQFVDPDGKKSKWMECCHLKHYIRKQISNKTAFQLAFEAAGFKK